MPPPNDKAWASFRNATYFGRGAEQYGGDTRTAGPFGEPRWCLSNGPDQAYAWNGSTYALIKGTCEALTSDEMSPEQAAEQAIAKIKFTAPGVGIGPNPDTNKIGMLVVGYNVWFFANGGTTKPATITDSVGSHDVSLSIRVKNITWHVGDGTILTCAGGGTPYPTEGLDDVPSPDCGHQYEKTGHYTVVGVTTWQVDWTASGTAGSEDVTLTSSRQFQVGELHSVNR